jgi:dimethylhistidine N-methyltransferase
MFDRTEDAFAASVIEGLSQTPKRLEPKWFYDAEGSRLFDRICDLPEYYPTRAETAILTAEADAIAAEIGPDATLWEPGAGSAVKARILLDALERPAAYAPVDICADHVAHAAEALRADYPDLRVEPGPLDFTAPLDPPTRHGEGPVTAFFPGSTIGNLDPDAAADLMRRFREEAGAERLLIGADLVKDETTLVAAYDDTQGVTGAFNRNLLARINRELGGDFDLDAFAHRAVFDRQASRIEMRLESLQPQVVTVRGERFAFAQGEQIVTEHSYKYDPRAFAALARRGGWARPRVWTGVGLFGVFLFEAA